MKLNRICIILAVFVLAACISGCGSTAAGSAETASQAAESSASSESIQAAEPVPEAAAEPEDSAEAAGSELEEPAEPEVPAVESMLPENYPMICEDGSVTLSIMALSSLSSELVSDYNDVPFWQQVSEKTGLNFEWQLVSFFNQNEQFNLLVAANCLPNIVGVADQYTGGITAAVEEDIFVDIGPYLADYAPDYKAIIDRDDIRGSVYDENGSAVCFYGLMVKDTEKPAPNNGVFLRGDLLEEQGLDVPVTYDEYEDAMLRLKDAYNMEAPIFVGSSSTTNTMWLSAGLGIKKDISLDNDGNVIYGPLEDAFREYLQIMNRWYGEGLIFRDFYAEDTGNMISNMVEYMGTGKSALAFGYCEFISMIGLSDPNGRFEAGYIPRKNAEDQIHLTEGIDPLISTTGYAIGTNSTEEEVQDICMLMNYFYTDEGSLFCSFGTEGESFEYQEDGTPWYTDLILDNPDGLTVTEALGFYTGYMVPCSDTRKHYNISTYTKWADLVDVWSTADNDNVMPNVSLTPDESYEYSRIVADVNSYLDEVHAKFIIGDMDPNDDSVWNEYLDTMKSLGAETIVDIYSAALERYRNI